MQVRDKSWGIFAVINRKINDYSAELNWICSNGLLPINAGQLPLYEITYFKDVIVLFDGICNWELQRVKEVLH